MFVLYFSKLNDLMYQVFLMTLTADYKFGQIESQDKLMAQILVGTYLALASLVCLNLYIALMSDTFARIWNRATANAFMSQASELLITEENLSESKHVEMSEVLLKSCSPQVSDISIVFHPFSTSAMREKSESY